MHVEFISTGCVGVVKTVRFCLGIHGDGRCMFRSVAYGACLRSGKPAPSGSFQTELADDLRAKVCFHTPSLVHQFHYLYKVSVYFTTHKWIFVLFACFLL